MHSLRILLSHLLFSFLLTPYSLLFKGAHGYFCIVDLDQPIPEYSNIFPPDHVRARRHVPNKKQRTRSGSLNDAPVSGRKRKRSLSGAIAMVETSGNFTICLRYGNMLFMDFIADNEMIVVEQPWMDIVNALPDSVERRVYGA